MVLVERRWWVAWGVGTVGKRRAHVYCRGTRLEWLDLRWASAWDGSKCTNDCEQSGHSNHEYWICMGAHLHHATPTLFPVELGLLLFELNLPTEHRRHMLSWGRCEEGETVETVSKRWGNKANNCNTQGTVYALQLEEVLRYHLQMAD